MADRYIYSGASGAGTGADWANAHTTLAAAITAGAAGDVYYVAHDHSETQASALTLTFKGTSASPDRVLCVDRAGAVPPVEADLRKTATVTTTGASAMQINGIAYFYGINFSAGTGATGAELRAAGSAGVQNFEACSFTIPTTATNSRVDITNGSNGRCIWTDCTVSFGNTSQSIRCSGGLFIWKNKPGATAITGATIPSTLISWLNTNNGCILFGLDLSTLSGTIFAAPTSGITSQVINCRLHASVTISATPTAVVSAGVDLLNSNSGAVNYRNDRYRYQGTLSTETTIVRTAGASDGTTAFSHKVVSTANNERDFPFITFDGQIWNDAVGSAKTLTVHIVTDNVTLTDADIWLEAEYLGDASYPVSSVVSDAPATVLTTAANQASDSGEAWTTTGLTTPVKQKLEVTFTPQMKGPVTWRVCFAKTSSTVYICPKADLT